MTSQRTSHLTNGVILYLAQRCTPSQVTGAGNELYRQGTTPLSRLIALDLTTLGQEGTLSLLKPRLWSFEFTHGNEMINVLITVNALGVLFYCGIGYQDD